MTDKDAAFQARLRAVARVKKLLALAGNNPNENEAASARQQAEKLAGQHGIDLDNLSLQPVRKNAINVNAFEMTAANISKAFPGIDTEDYSKYAKKGKEDDRNRDETD